MLPINTKSAAWRRAEAFALDDVHAARDGVEQRVGQMIGQQVHLVDVEDAAVRLREQTRLQARARRSWRCSISRPPSMRSSVAPIGRLTNGAPATAEQRRRERRAARGRALSRAFVAAQQHAQAPIDRGQLQRQLQRRRAPTSAAKRKPLRRLSSIVRPCARFAARLDERFGLRAAPRAARRASPASGSLPQAALGGFEQALRDRVQRPRIRLREKSRISGDSDVFFGEPLIDEIRRDVRGRVEAEDVVDRRRQLEAALVAMAADARRATSD